MILCDCSAVLAVGMRNVLHEGACTGVSLSASASGVCRFVLADSLFDFVLILFDLGRSCENLVLYL